MSTIHLKLGVTDLSFHHVTASLVSHVLTDMGFTVERIYAPHQDNFKNLKSGEVDLLASAWLPSSHGIYKADVEQVMPLVELGLHYEPYAHWGVPDYVPQSAVNEISDLLKPDVLSKMQKKIQGINAGAGITRFSINMMKEYGLTSAGYEFLTGTEHDCFSAFENAVATQTWCVVPLWKPQFLHYKHTIRELKEPQGLLGVVDRAVLLLREDKQALFNQAQLNTLDKLRFSNEIIAELDYKVCKNLQPLDDLTRNWLNNNPIKK